MNYFRCGGSEKVTIDGEKVKDKLKLYSNMPKGIEIGIIQFSDIAGCGLVVYNNEIHILGGMVGSYSSSKIHYKWNGSTWTSVSTLPYSFRDGITVVYNNEIHIIGGTTGGSPYQYHYKWDGTTWTKLDDFIGHHGVGKSGGVVYNNEIHVIGGIDYGDDPLKQHYKWNGTTWTNLNNTPFEMHSITAVVYDGNIHITGGGSTNHYKWDGVTWTKMPDVPFSMYSPASVVRDGRMCVLGNRDNSYEWDGATWTKLSNLPYDIGGAVIYNGKFNIFGWFNGTSVKRHSVIETPLYASIPSSILGIYV